MYDLPVECRRRWPGFIQGSNHGIEMDLEKGLYFIIQIHVWLFEIKGLGTAGKPLRANREVWNSYTWPNVIQKQPTRLTCALYFLYRYLYSVLYNTCTLHIYNIYYDIRTTVYQTCQRFFLSFFFIPIRLDELCVNV